MPMKELVLTRSRWTTAVEFSLRWLARFQPDEHAPEILVAIRPAAANGRM